MTKKGSQQTAKAPVIIAKVWAALRSRFASSILRRLARFCNGFGMLASNLLVDVMLDFSLSCCVMLAAVEEADAEARGGGSTTLESFNSRLAGEFWVLLEKALDGEVAEWM